MRQLKNDVARTCIVVATAGTLLSGCCHCPPPSHAVSAEACPEPSPEGVEGAADPAVADGTDPGRGDAAGSTPASLEALIDRVPPDRSVTSYRGALSVSLGARVRWRLRSWGGELSSEGYETPAGRQPPEERGTEMGRIRFVSTSLGAGADLGDVQDERQPVVACLARFPRGDDPLFVWSDDRREPAPGPGVVVVEGSIWGALREGGSVTLWLRDCAVVDDPSQ